MLCWYSFKSYVLAAVLEEQSMRGMLVVMIGKMLKIYISAPTESLGYPMVMKNVLPYNFVGHSSKMKCFKVELIAEKRSITVKRKVCIIFKELHTIHFKTVGKKHCSHWSRLTYNATWMCGCLDHKGWFYLLWRTQILNKSSF